ncbi:hypothetical protein [Halorubrum trueperi]|uniref:Gins51 C-terminal domain-containing protein n=1 Tax=Halorubrum trueperi TaxID=2004704 RepID=A0ABD5UI25_9EURY
MNLDELRSAQAKERRKDSLQHLRDSFYDDVAAYVADLRAARDRRAEQVAKPFSDDDVRRMSDEVETAEEVAEALYERRVGKVVKLASFAAADMPVDADGMTTEERRLFDDLVDRIGENKSRVLDVLSGEAPAGAEPSAVSGNPTDETPGGSTEETMSADADPATPEPEGEPAADASTQPSSAEADAAADALAGAMGGDDDGVADAIDATAADVTGGGTADETPPVPPEDGTGANDAVADDAASPDGGPATDGGPTAVPPEPAPPGASGVSDGDGADVVQSEPSAASEQDGSGSASAAATDPTAAVDADSAIGDRETVRITRDVGAIFGVDEREYDLASEDVVNLPVENADPLVERDAAERLD